MSETYSDILEATRKEDTGKWKNLLMRLRWSDAVFMKTLSGIHEITTPGSNNNYRGTNNAPFYYKIFY